MSENTPTPEFESTLAELEALVQRLERGDLSLDESLKAYERAVALSRACQQSLQASELRVKKLTQDGVLEDLETDEDDLTEEPDDE
ncbi:MAG: exodeoxyribonuclease VII small subunit [Gammaproteobacteria bacterium]|nr:exodeoxyribonuclease VII small subunit [Gammaproteobacteria bacterium]